MKYGMSDTFQNNIRLQQGRRRGSTIVVVIALLAALMLLGVLFFTIASQEQENAYLFSEAAKQTQYPDDFFDFGLEAMIVGPRDDLFTSALWGGRAGLMATMFGSDSQPFNGEGVNLAWDGNTGRIIVDQKFDLGPDEAPYAGTTYNPRNINLSPVAQDQVVVDAAIASAGPNAFDALPQPDAEYTYPDINSPFLAYVGTTPKGNRVIIPSFHRPQLLRDIQPDASQWYTDPNTARAVLRPHREHKAVDASGKVVASSRLYISSTEPSGPGSDVAIAGVFPINVSEDLNGNGTLDPGEDLNGNGTIDSNEGIWSATGAIGPNSVSDSAYRYDADTDGDGVNEAVWLNLGHPPLEIAGKTLVPLYAITVYDADGLFNINAHGNAHGLVNWRTPAIPFGGAAAGVTQPLSRSNLGLTTHEVDLTAGLDANPATATTGTFAQHGTFYNRTPADITELANMEWWFALVGRPQYNSSGTVENLHPGRNGEEALLQQAVATGSPNAMPAPGATGTDDDNNRVVGLDTNGVNAALDPTRLVFPTALHFLADGHLLDLYGSGRVTLANTGGKQREFGNNGGFRFPGFRNYWFTPAADGGSAWSGLLGNALATFTQPGLVRAYTVGTKTFRWPVDVPTETDLEGNNQVGGDATFSASENAALQLAKGDQDAIRATERLLTLLPYNFDTDADAQERRRRYTTTSHDLKSSGRPRLTTATLYRPWEYDSGTDKQFPPLFAGGNDANGREPFRREVRALLKDVRSTNAIGLMRKLSVNHVAEEVTNQNEEFIAQGRIRLRPLTPHPTDWSNATSPLRPVREQVGLSSPKNGGPAFGTPDVNLLGIAPNVMTYNLGANTPAPQEFAARRDRQNLARDIYVLLYTLGKPTATTSNNPVQTANTITVNAGPPATESGTVYSVKELREMAQFAVNLVDQMDPDSVSTCFVYDLNLFDGYTPYDDGYADAVPYNTTLGGYEDTNIDGRGMVYGVERQPLTINEAMFTLTAPVKRPAPATGFQDHILTEWDDAETRDFSYIELLNPNPDVANLGGQVQVTVRTEKVMPGLPPVVLGERRLTLLGTNVVDAAGGLFTIAAAGDDHNRERNNPPAPHSPGAMSTNKWPTTEFNSRMRVNVKDTKATVQGQTDFNQFLYLAPYNMPNVGTNLDLVNSNASLYQVYKAAAAGAFEDGAPVDGFRPYNQPSADAGLLDLGGAGARDTIAKNPAGAGESYQVVVELRQRLNANRPAYNALTAQDPAASQDNPWVVRDRMTVSLGVLRLQSDDDNAGGGNFAQQFQDQVNSKLRTRPLTAASEKVDLTPPTPAPNDSGVGRNSLGGINTLNAIYTLWQPQPDQPYSSLAGLLEVPLYGPQNLTQTASFQNVAYPIGLGNVDGVLLRENVAAARFLFPDADVRNPSPPDPSRLALGENFWFRLLEQLEVPENNGSYQQFGSSPWFTIDGGPGPNSNGRIINVRRHGKINLNTVRHPQVLAGLLADYEVFQHPAFAANPAYPLVSQSGETLDSNTPLLTGVNREWWGALLLSRDGVDPVTRDVLPGLPALGRPPLGLAAYNGRPFRTMSMAVRGTAGSPNPFSDLEDTVLRRLPGTTGGASPIDQRGLFELGGSAQQDDINGFDYTTRYRLLSKVLNHSTVRSNTFLVFMKVQFFKAIIKDNGTPTDLSDDYVRIGEADPNHPGYRTFFTVDRTKAFETISNKDLPLNNQFKLGGSGTYAGQTLRTSTFARNPDGTPTFDWRQLILSRTVIE